MRVPLPAARTRIASINEGAGKLRAQNRAFASEIITDARQNRGNRGDCFCAVGMAFESFAFQTKPMSSHNDSRRAEHDQFQTEAPPQSTAPANTRPGEIAELDATRENGAGRDATLESNGATAHAQATPGESRSQGAPPHSTESQK